MVAILNTLNIVSSKITIFVNKSKVMIFEYFVHTYLWRPWLVYIHVHLVEIVFDWFYCWFFVQIIPSGFSKSSSRFSDLVEFGGLSLRSYNSCIYPVCSNIHKCSICRIISTDSQYVIVVFCILYNIVAVAKVILPFFVVVVFDLQAGIALEEVIIKMAAPTCW